MAAEKGNNRTGYALCRLLEGSPRAGHVGRSGGVALLQKNGLLEMGTQACQVPRLHL